MTQPPNPQGSDTPIDIGLELLLAHQRMVTDLVAFGLATLIVVLAGSLGVIVVSLTAWLAVLLRSYGYQLTPLVRTWPTTSAGAQPNQPTDKGEDDGI